MQRVNLDSTGPSVKEFIQSLPLQGGSVELELEGRIICNVVPPGSEFWEVAQARLLQRGRELVRRARERNEGVPQSLVDEEIALAVDEVRQRQRGAQ